MGWVVSGARVLAATALIPTAWVWTVGTAQAATSNGVTVPSVVFAQGSGQHAVGITIASTSKVVGSADTIAVSASSPYIVAVSGTAVGATCTAGSAGAWSCHASAWKAGTIRVTVSTTTADCTTSGVCQSALSARVEGTAGWVVQGGVEITPKPAASPSPSPSAARSTPATASPAASSSASVAASRASAAPSTSAGTSSALIPAPLGSVAGSSEAASGGPVASGAAAGPGVPVAAQVTGAHAASSGGGATTVLLACAVLLLAGVLAAWRILAGRHRRAAVASQVLVEPEAVTPAAAWSAFESRPKPQAAPPAERMPDPTPQPTQEPGAPAEPE